MIVKDAPDVSIVNNIFKKTTEQAVYETEVTVLKLIADLLIGQTFIGNFAYRTLVPSLQKYRDKIIIDENESAFITNLTFAKKHLLETKLVKWTGIEIIKHESLECSLLLQLNSVTLGEHAFTITRIHLDNQELIISVKCSDLPATCPVSSTSSDVPWLQYLTDKNNIEWLSEILVSFLKQTVTIANIKEASRFTLLFIVMSLGFLYEVFQVILTATVTILRILPRYITAIMPFLLAVVDAFNKCVGGFYLLIWAMFRGDGRVQRQLPPRLAIQHDPLRRTKPYIR